MRKTKEVRKLECILTDSEKLNYSKELSDAIHEKSHYEDSLKSYSTQAKAEIQLCQEKINLLASKISTGKEFREVECVIVYNWTDGKRYYHRPDTGAIIDFETIPAEDLQEHIDLKEKEGTEQEPQDNAPRALEDKRPDDEVTNEK
jgi:hypothetical protein